MEEGATTKRHIYIYESMSIQAPSSKRRETVAPTVRTVASMILAAASLAPSAASSAGTAPNCFYLEGKMWQREDGGGC
jgi:hypothetical protein